MVLQAVFGGVSVCRHQPSCSEYFLQAAEKDGWRGWWRGLKRILTCVGHENS
ncbi:membrane protein insertion efficiency factor YidD [bacterium]|nr:membrane protein insertion efficiency factor YidD [bacterium]